MAGKTFTAADISCGCAIWLARYAGFEDRLDPKVHDYATRLAERPALQRATSTGQPQTA